MKDTRQRLFHLLAASPLLFVAPLAAATQAGLGVSINSGGEGGGGYGVSVPLRFGGFTVEPELSYYNYSADRDYSLSPSSNQSYEYQQFSIETGVYWRQPMIPSVEMYVGGRVGYTRYEYSYTYPSSPVSNYSDDTSGFYLGPTLGAEYFFNKHFSLGLDASLLFESTSGDVTNASDPYEQDRTSIYYQGRARLRFYF